ncbi:MAPEG family protein [Sphingobium phenoxybenzoativorans]|uniref:MAPEG family protein n=1 Tax=Sphingobium phenoxybenzoativorans TaxID=1592790 RepID=A0A975K536_9SPHN|nr:MAPEG family protein [Sphingobium phenoxybenzoativorans]QUT04985.1 MAPEG family protein [Sphingobium phenoxybenzoativorans]
MLLPITLTLAAAAALLNMWLAMRVGRTRMSNKVLHGDGGCEPLVKRMRAQANFVEYTPFVIILFGLIELATGPQTWLWLLALVYILARIAHAFGMDHDTPHKARMIGILVTFATIIILSIAALYVAYGSMRQVEAPPTLAAHV